MKRAISCLIVVLAVAGCSTATQTSCPATATGSSPGSGAFQRCRRASPRRPFGSDGRMGAQLGCNLGGAAYTAEGDQLTLGPLVSTKRACANPVGNELEGRTPARSNGCGASASQTARSNCWTRTVASSHDSFDGLPPTLRRVLYRAVDLIADPRHAERQAGPAFAACSSPTISAARSTVSRSAPPFATRSGRWKTSAERRRAKRWHF